MCEQAVAVARGQGLYFNNISQGESQVNANFN